jgi:hypothetical protein
LLPDFFKYIYKESLNDRPNDKVFLLTASALIYDWFGMYDSAKSLIKNVGFYITDDTPHDLLGLYYHTAGSIANHENDLDAAAKHYQHALRMDLLSNNVMGSISLSTELKNISQKQHQPRRTLYYTHMGDSLRMVANKKLRKEEIIREKVVAFERQKAFGKLPKENTVSQNDKPKSLPIALCMVGFVVTLALCIFSKPGKELY